MKKQTEKTSKSLGASTDELYIIPFMRIQRNVDSLPKDETNTHNHYARLFRDKNKKNWRISKSVDCSPENKAIAFKHSPNLFRDKSKKNTRISIIKATSKTFQDLFQSQDTNQMSQVTKDLQYIPLLPRRVLFILCHALSNWAVNDYKEKYKGKGLDLNATFKLQISEIVTYAVHQFNNLNVSITNENVSLYTQIIHMLGVFSDANLEITIPKISNKLLWKIEVELGKCQLNSKCISQFILGMCLLSKNNQLDTYLFNGKFLSKLLKEQADLTIDNVVCKDLAKSFYGLLWHIKAKCLVNFNVDVDVMEKLVTMVFTTARLEGEPFEQVEILILTTILALREEHYLTEVDADTIVVNSVKNCMSQSKSSLNILETRDNSDELNNNVSVNNKGY